MGGLGATADDASSFDLSIAPPPAREYRPTGAARCGITDQNRRSTPRRRLNRLPVAFELVAVDGERLEERWHVERNFAVAVSDGSDC